MERHKWDINLTRLPKTDGNNGGAASSCLKCGCVKEYVKGVPTYFKDDEVHIYIAPKCVGVILNSKTSTDSNNEIQTSNAAK